MKSNRALFLDRDGVINLDYGYVHKICDFTFRPEIFEICKTALSLKYKIIIVTNQAGIGRGIFTENDFITLCNYMKSIFKQNKIKITDIYHCPFHPKKGINKFLKESFDRKPNPGMLIKAAIDHKIKLEDSIMIGDNISDQQAALSANLKYFINANEESWGSETIKLLKANLNY
tara:strand:- start:1625 stop:2146 length:522 start_codon:yes stop_codon:yes gene_type:complete